jgi:hypothetical protein
MGFLSDKNTIKCHFFKWQTVPNKQWHARHEHCCLSELKLKLKCLDTLRDRLNAIFINKRNAHRSLQPRKMAISQFLCVVSLANYKRSDCELSSERIGTHTRHTRLHAQSAVYSSRFAFDRVNRKPVCNRDKR